MTIVYVPATVDVLVHEPPAVPNSEGERRLLPSGFLIETLALQQPDEPIVTLERSSANDVSAPTVNVNLPFWPGSVVVSDTDGPSIVTAPPFTSAATS